MADSVTQIGEQAFGFCSSLTTVKLSGSLQILDYSTFQSTALTTIVLPKSLQIIGQYSFYNTNLQTITIPESVTSIGNSVFDSTNTTCVAVLNSAIADSVNVANKQVGPDAFCPDANYQDHYDDNHRYVFNTLSNGTKIWLANEYVYMYYVEDGKKYVTYPCPEEYSLEKYQSDIDKIRCYNVCSSEYFYKQEYHCVADCYENYGRPVDQLSYVCDQYCLNYKIWKLQRQCVDECPQQYKYITFQDFECTSYCPSSISYAQDEYCLNYCTETYNLIQNEQCVSICTRGYAVPIDYPNVNICDDTCMYQTINYFKYCTLECTQYNQGYILNNSVRKYCIRNCSLSPEYNLKYTDEQGVNYCVDKCPEGYIEQNNMCEAEQQQCEEWQYIQEDQCVEFCTGDYAIINISQICNISCKYYVNNGIKYCIDVCQEIGYYEIPDPIRPYCVQNCSEVQQFYYLQDEQCVEQCDQIYPLIQENVCVFECNDQYQYIQGINCTEYCTYEYAIPLYPIIYCSDTCAFEVQNQIKYCVSNESTCPDDMYLVQQHNNSRDECVDSTDYYIQLENGIKQAVDQCPDDYPYIVNTSQSPFQCIENCLNTYNNHYLQEGWCVIQCDGEYAKPESGYTCDNECQYHIEGDYKYCDSVCEEPYQYHANLDRDQCVQDCNDVDIDYAQNGVCVDQCTEDYAQPFNNTIECSNTCAFIILMNIKYCVSDNNICPDIMYLIQQHNNTRDECTNITEYYIKLNNGTKQIIDNCNETYPYIIVINQQLKECISDCDGVYIQINECVEQCYGDYAIPSSGLICNNTCQYYTFNNTKYCIEGCNDNQYMQDNICVDQCTNDYAYPFDKNNKQCNNTCNYYIFNITLKQCVKDNICINEGYTYAYDFNGRYQCILYCDYYTYINEQNLIICTQQDNCDGIIVNNQQLEYIEENMCVSKCQNEYAYPQNKLNKICNSTCKYYINNNIKYCTEQCPINYNYTILNPIRQYCIESCQNDLNYSLTQDQYCAKQCQNNTLLDNNNCVYECQQNKYQYKNSCMSECEYYYQEIDYKLYCIEYCYEKINSDRECIKVDEIEWEIEEEQEILC